MERARGKSLRRLPRKEIERLFTAAAGEWDRMARRVMVAEALVRKLSRSSGRNFDRLIAAEQRADAAEVALASSSSKPARVGSLLIRALRLLRGLPDPCPSCGLRGGHRYNCRVESLTRALDSEMDEQIGRIHQRETEKLSARLKWTSRKK